MTKYFSIPVFVLKTPADLMALHKKYCLETEKKDPFEVDRKRSIKEFYQILKLIFLFYFKSATVVIE